MRGVEAVWPTEDGFAVLCDCAMTTQVHIRLEGAHGEPLQSAEGGTVAPQEIAVTCEGCGSAHWLTITPSEPKP